MIWMFLIAAIAAAIIVFDHFDNDRDDDPDL